MTEAGAVNELKDRLIAPGARLIEAATGLALDGAQIHARAGEVGAALNELPPGPVFTLVEPSLAAVLRYLGAWEARRAVLPLDPGMTDTTLVELVERFRPALLTGLEEHRALGLAELIGGYRYTKLASLGPGLVRSAETEAPTQHPDLALLLATSGSTGRPKLVRLSRSGVTATAAAIATATEITPDDVAVTALPLFYTYGLSVLNSQLRAGATVVLADGDITNQGFWNAVTTHTVTSLSLVPGQYEILRRLRHDLGPIRTMTISGGRLRDETMLHFHERLRGQGGKLYSMYGQTEAGSRISVLPPECLPEKLGCVGPGIPGVALSIRVDGGADTVEPGVTGEVICHGPGVMMGYATEARDLSEPDGCHGSLRTGDLGRLDAEGHLWLTGRISRIAKVFGVRLDLAAVEQLLAGHGPVAVVPVDDRIRVWLENPDIDPRQLGRQLAEQLRVHRTGIDVRITPCLPVLPSGKTDYRALEEQL